jgi:hypothetical protein
MEPAILTDHHAGASRVATGSPRLGALRRKRGQRAARLVDKSVGKAAARASSASQHGDKSRLRDNLLIILNEIQIELAIKGTIGVASAGIFILCISIGDLAILHAGAACHRFVMRRCNTGAART